MVSGKGLKKKKNRSAKLNHEETNLGIQSEMGLRVVGNGNSITIDFDQGRRGIRFHISTS